MYFKYAEVFVLSFGRDDCLCVPSEREVICLSCLPTKVAGFGGDLDQVLNPARLEILVEGTTCPMCFEARKSDCTLGRALTLDRLFY